MSKLYLFSEVRGVVVSRGESVAGAVVERTYHWHWKDAEGTDRTVTNDQGEFYLPEITGRAMMAWLPHEVVIQQKITIKRAGKSYPAWVYAKGDGEKNGELGGKPIVLYCSLEAEPKHIPTGQWGSKIYGICDLR